METNAKRKFVTVDEYLSSLAPEARKVIDELRHTVKQIVPEAEEVISYNMPSYKLHKILINYAAWKEHIGIYPPIPAHAPFKKELAVYEGEKGAIRFPMNQPLPVALLTKIIKFRVQEDQEKAKKK